MVRVPLLLPLGAAMVSSSEEVQKLAVRVESDVAMAARREFSGVTRGERASGEEVLRWVEASSYAGLCADDEFAAAWEYASDGAESLDRAGYGRFVEAVYEFARRRLAREPPSLGKMMKSMLKSPSMRKMVTKMAVGVAETGGLLGPGEERLRIDGGGGAGAGTSLAAAEVAEIEREMDDLLQSEAFGDLMDRVVESPGIRDVFEGIQSGGAMPSFGDLAETVTSSLCDEFGLGGGECAELRRETSARMAQMGWLFDDGPRGPLGAFLRPLLERCVYCVVRFGVAASLAAFAAACLVVVSATRALARALRRPKARREPSRPLPPTEVQSVDPPAG